MAKRRAQSDGRRSTNMAQYYAIDRKGIVQGQTGNAANPDLGARVTGKREVIDSSVGSVPTKALVASETIDICRLARNRLRGPSNHSFFHSARELRGNLLFQCARDEFCKRTLTSSCMVALRSNLDGP